MDKVKWLAVCFACLICVSCSGGGPVRELDFTSKEVEAQEIDQYHSQYLYGPTQKIFHFTDKNAVMIVRMSNKNTDFETQISINIFGMKESTKTIKKWINNQHSDGLFSDAPEPISVANLDQSDYSVTSSKLIDHIAGNAGDEYDNYRVEYSVNNITEGKIFTLNSFNDEALVHVRTKDMDKARDRDDEKKEKQ